jgi:hypothetical protein
MAVLIPIYLWNGNLDLNKKTGSKNLNCGDELFEECSRIQKG